MTTPATLTNAHVEVLARAAGPAGLPVPDVVRDGLERAAGQLHRLGLVAWAAGCRPAVLEATGEGVRLLPAIRAALGPLADEDAETAACVGDVEEADRRAVEAARSDGEPDRAW